MSFTVQEARAAFFNVATVTLPRITLAAQKLLEQNCLQKSKAPNAWQRLRT
jgi:hypothetical protein